MYRWFILLTMSLLLQLFAFASSECIPRDYTTWDYLRLSVIYQPNNPGSVKSKTVLQTLFCNEFSISPCSVTSNNNDNSSIFIFENFGVNIPVSNYSTILPWFMQHRSHHVLNTTYDVDLYLVPDSGCTYDDEHKYMIYSGHSYPFNILSLWNNDKLKSNINNDNNHHHENDNIHDEINDDMYIDQETKDQHMVDMNYNYINDTNNWAYNCSSDATCYQPYAEHTTCTNYKNIKSFHLHLYYKQNDEFSVYAKDRFTNLTSSLFNISMNDICADTNGHEQYHGDVLCWLTGPQGTESLYPQDSQTSSFIIGTHSLYIGKSYFQTILPYLMYIQKNITILNADGGNGDANEVLRFLLHPCFGCNYADHQEWSFNSGNYRNNMFGISSEAGYGNNNNGDEEKPFSLDTYSANYYLNTDRRRPRQCKKLTRDGHVDVLIDTFLIHLLYNNNNVTQRKNAWLLAIEIISIRGIEHNTDIQGNYNESYLNDTNSPFLTAHIDIEFWLFGSIHYINNNNSEMFETVISSLMNFKTNSIYDGIDILFRMQVINCVYSSFVTTSMYNGNHWYFNLHSFYGNNNYNSYNSDRGRKSKNKNNTHKTLLPVTSGQPIKAYIIYVLSAPNNKWQREALETWLQLFSKEFGVARQECTSLYPSDIEPNYDSIANGSVCMMQENMQPYKNVSDPMVTSYGAVYVPTNIKNFNEIIVWSMLFCDPTVNGVYGLDLMLVPLSFEKDQYHVDFGTKAFHIGAKWEVNTHALV